jgi:hypothetical protein
MSELELRPAWRRDDTGIEADAIAFWRRLGALPRNVSPQNRAKELCVAAYRNGELTGVSTIALQVFPQIKARLGLFRCLVDPAHRRAHVARRLAVASRDLLSDWSLAHPREKVLGMATIVESPDLAEFAKQPVWPASGLVLVGHTRLGHQIRLVWFEHARLD